VGLDLKGLIMAFVSPSFYADFLLKQ